MAVRYVAMLVALLCFAISGSAQNKPNIIVIMGDDIGWFNIGVYNQGMMAGRTPNLDKLARRKHRQQDRSNLLTSGEPGARLDATDPAKDFALFQV